MSLEGSSPESGTEKDRHTTTYGDKSYDVVRLFDHAAELPVETISITVLEDRKQDTCWHDGNGNDIGPAELLTAIGDRRPIDWDGLVASHPHLEEHLRKTEHADYHTHPLLMRGEHDLIDGMHRLVRAWVDGAQSLRIQRFTSMPADAEVPHDHSL